MELKGCISGRDLRNNRRLVSWKTAIPTVTIMITVPIPREYMKNLYNMGRKLMSVKVIPTTDKNIGNVQLRDATP